MKHFKEEKEEMETRFKAELAEAEVLYATDARKLPKLCAEGKISKEDMIGAINGRVGTIKGIYRSLNIPFRGDKVLTDIVAQHANQTE